MSEVKPREWFIEDIVDGRIFPENGIFIEYKGNPPKNLIKVIEKSAYDKLASELAEVKRINSEDCISRGLHESRMKAADEREAFLKSQNERLIEALNEEKLVQIIYDWKHGWMDVQGTNEQDRKNYFIRAFGVDANMAYSLAKQLREKTLAEIESEEK